MLRDASVEPIVTPYRAPNCAALAERFVRSIKEECLDRMILFGENSLRGAVRECVQRYLGERPHQGLGNLVIDQASGLRPNPSTDFRVSERLGGLLRHYRTAA